MRDRTSPPRYLRLLDKVNTAGWSSQKSSLSRRVDLSRHYFDGSALNSLFGGAVVIPYPKWWEGNEKQTDILHTSGDIASATVLRRTVTTRANRTPVPWWPNMYQPSTMEPGNDTRVTEIVTTIEPASANLVSQEIIRLRRQRTLQQRELRPGIRFQYRFSWEPGARHSNHIPDELNLHRYKRPHPQSANPNIYL